MASTNGDDVRPVRTKAVLIDPASMTLVWMNEAAAQSLLDRESGFSPGMNAEAVVSMTGTQDVMRALQEVADTGEDRHLQVDLVSTGRGSVTITSSVYKLPGDMLLLLADNSWQVKHRAAEDPSSRGATRRRR